MEVNKLNKDVWQQLLIFMTPTAVFIHMMLMLILSLVTHVQQVIICWRMLLVQLKMICSVTVLHMRLKDVQLMPQQEPVEQLQLPLLMSGVLIVEWVTL